MVTTGERKPWHAIFRLLERDERVFAVLLAVAMVAGLATLGLVPLRPRQQIDLNSLVLWFTLYKIGIFALVTVYPTRTRAIFLGALGIDLLLIFVLMFLTAGRDTLFYHLFFPLLAVNAYYFGPWLALATALVAGGLFAAASALQQGEDPCAAARCARSAVCGLDRGLDPGCAVRDSRGHRGHRGRA